jgi:ketosteroid isomerase-like protein
VTVEPDTERAMSQENVEIVRRSLDAWNRGDLDELLAGFAPEVEFHTTGLFADDRVYRGHEGVARLRAQFDEDMEELNASISEIRAIGDKVFVAVVAKGRGKQSKAGYVQPLWYVGTFRDGLVVRIESYADPEPALEAAGLAE